MGLSITDRKVLKVYVAEFNLGTQHSQKSEVLQSIELGVKSILSGRHGAIDIHLLKQRSAAQFELLLSIERVANRLQAEYTINALPRGNTLAYGRFEEDESKIFHLQDVLSEQILTVLRE
jgi:TolB-like protein